MSEYISPLDIDEHSQTLVYHSAEKMTLISNPDFFFYAFSIKFISLEEVRKMKAQRAERKDVEDCILIENVGNTTITNKALRTKIILIQSLRKRPQILKQKAEGFLKAIGIYGFVKRIYLFLKNHSD